MAESDEDPEPACPPPSWAADIIQAAQAQVGLEVYPPSDDTFLLLEALKADARKLQALRPKVCIELGCGSGAVSVGLWDILSQEDLCPKPFMIAVDKNPAALACTASLFQRFGLPRAEVLRASMTHRFCQTEVDIIVCNPPYVPTDEEEMQGCGISVSWAGGRRGREVIDLTLPEVAKALTPGGFFYLVCIAENNPAELLALGRSFGLSAHEARREQRGMEELSILRFQRDCAEPEEKGGNWALWSALRHQLCAVFAGTV